MECILTSLKYGALAALTAGSFVMCAVLIAPIVILVCCIMSKLMNFSSGGVVRDNEQ